MGGDIAIMSPSVRPAQCHRATVRESGFPLHTEMSSCLQTIADHYDFTQLFYYILKRNKMEQYPYKLKQTDVSLMTLYHFLIK